MHRRTLLTLLWSLSTTNCFLVVGGRFDSANPDVSFLPEVAIARPDAGSDAFPEVFRDVPTDNFVVSVDAEQPDVPVDAPIVGTVGARLAVGTFHTCVRRSNGAVVCWGANSFGLLGHDRTNGEGFPPETISALPSIFELSTGQYTTFARSINGVVYAWGRNNVGQFGRETTPDFSTAPVIVSGLPAVEELAAADGHACARAETSVYCWGTNTEGQLDATLEQTSFRPPALVRGLPPSTQIALGTYFSCALTTNNRVFCWGANALGQLFSPPTMQTYAPRDMGIADVVQISIGSAHGCALQRNGSVQCWGWTRGGFTQQTPTRVSTNPVVVPALWGVRELALGDRQTCGIQSDQTVVCVREGSDGSVASYVVPTLRNVAQVGVGTEHACALLRDETVWCWGSNGGGQLGRLGADSEVPVQVQLP